MNRTRVPSIYVERLQEALRNNPDRVPLEDEDVLLARIIYVLLLSPRTVDYIQRLGMQRDHRFIHAIGRDRRNVKDLKAALAQGKTHYQGKRIAGSANDPHVMRWSRKQVMAVLREVVDLTYNLYELEEMLGLPQHSYRDDDSSMI